LTFLNLVVVDLSCNTLVTAFDVIEFFKMDDVLLIRIEERISDLEKHLLPSDGDYNKVC